MINCFQFIIYFTDFFWDFCLNTNYNLVCDQPRNLSLFNSHEVYKGVDLMVYGTLIRNQDASFSLLISFLGVIENSYLFGCGKLYL
jgi:hypothetical protein